MTDNKIDVNIIPVGDSKKSGSILLSLFKKRQESDNITN